MEENKKVFVTVIVFIILAAVSAGIYYYFVHYKPREAAPVADLGKITSSLSPQEEVIEEREAPKTIQVDLDDSDGLVQKLATKISSHPIFVQWLKTGDLLRKFAAAVDNIANGMSTRPQVDFFTPEEEFKVIEENGRLYADPDNYYRYDLVAEVFSSLDTESCVKLYRQLKPAIQEAYKDLGYPDVDFEKTLTKAILELLKVPVVSQKIELDERLITYKMVSPDLEKLSNAQKHLLRMGPENVLKIRAKLNEIAIALGIPKEQLPH
ncbi:DUF3014 domain-containing protein [Acidobacteriota bacterium]